MLYQLAFNPYAVSRILQGNQNLKHYNEPIFFYGFSGTDAKTDPHCVAYV